VRTRAARTCAILRHETFVNGPGRVRGYRPGVSGIALQGTCHWPDAPMNECETCMESMKPAGDGFQGLRPDGSTRTLLYVPNSSGLGMVTNRLPLVYTCRAAASELQGVSEAATSVPGTQQRLHAWQCPEMGSVGARAGVRGRMARAGDKGWRTDVEMGNPLQS
jgi:hypothetical protein